MSVTTTASADIGCKQGEALVLQLGSSTIPGVTFNGVAMNWTGCSAQMDIRLTNAASALASATPASQASTAAGTIVLGSNGQVTATFSPTITAAIPVGTYRYDLRIVDSLGSPHYWLQGNVKISDRVTIGGGS